MAVDALRSREFGCGTALGISGCRCQGRVFLERLQRQRDSIRMGTEQPQTLKIGQRGEQVGQRVGIEYDTESRLWSGSGAITSSGGVTGRRRR